jgi:hypothetical protein
MLAVFALRVCALGIAVVVLGGCWAWACWLPVALERKRYAADKEERDHRQAGIEEAFRKWNEGTVARAAEGRPAEAAGVAPGPDAAVGAGGLAAAVGVWTAAQTAEFLRQVRGHRLYALFRVVAPG